MSSGRKSIGLYYSKIASKTILSRLDFFAAAWAVAATLASSRTWQYGSLSAAELAALWRATGCSAGRTWPGARAFVLVAEYQSALFQIIGRHLDGDPVARERLDPVLFHLAGGIGNDLVPRIELDAVARIGEDFGDQSFELNQLFFSHFYLQSTGSYLGR